MDYKHAAQQVLDCIGGKDNIVSAAHCATRLRLVIADNSRVRKKELENAEGVKGVFEAQGQLQIIFGTGTVNRVYDQFLLLAGIEGSSKQQVKQAAAARAPWYQRAVKTLGDIFVPIIPAIVASGFLMGLMEALNFMVSNGFLNLDTAGSVYVFAKLFSNAAYTFLPILIAYSAARVFGGDPYLGAVIGMIMIHPDLQNAWTVSDGVRVMQPVFGGLYSVPLVGYQGHVIPVILAVWLMCRIENWLHRVVPAMFDLFVTPLVSVFVTGYLTLAAIGPVFTKLENSIITGVQALITLPYGIGSFLVGGLYAVTVVVGVHHMYAMIDLGQLARYGRTPKSDLHKTLLTMGMADGAAYLIREYDLPLKMEDYNDVMWDVITKLYETVELKPGVRELLARLKAEGARMCICSNTWSDQCKTVLTRLGVDDCFEFYIEAQGPLHKSRPDVFWSAGRPLGCGRSGAAAPAGRSPTPQSCCRSGCRPYQRSIGCSSCSPPHSHTVIIY